MVAASVVGVGDGLSDAEQARLRELDAQRPPPLDSVDEIRARMAPPWEVGDARERADPIRREMAWPTTTPELPGGPE